MSKDDNKNSFINIGVLIGIIGILLALGGLLIAGVAWLIPFQPVGPSPFVQEQPQQSGQIESNTPIPPPTSKSVPPSNAPLREHVATSIGTGVFEIATFSDGLAPYDEDWLWDNNHFNIQRIRREENPDGCGTSQYQVDKIWIGAGAIATVTVNGSEIGTITTITRLSRHGYIVDVSLNVGDKICVSPIPASGFQIVFGPDIYYHHDTYCYRGSC